MYEYKVREIIKVIDGDTVDCCISLGFGLSATLRVRVAEIDTPETRGIHADVERGPAAADFTEHWLASRAEEGALILRTFKGSDATVGIGDGAFGRWLGHFVSTESGTTLTAALTAAGHVK